jgi:peptidoglycan/LPS O-acetylase OafA/YrhL
MSSRKAEIAHIPALDGLRGLAIILVLLNHTFGQGLVHFEGKASLFDNVLASTGYGVQLFFALSGFLITGILLDSKTSANYFRNFYIRRILRIFPLYYGILFAFVAVALVHGFQDDALFFHRLPWLVTYTSNVLITLRNDWSFIFGSHSLSHFWSLAVEEQFYFIWPAVVFFASARLLKQVALAAIALGFAARTYLLYVKANLLGALVFLPCQVDALAMGAFVALLVREDEALASRLGWPLAALAGALWLASCLEMNQLITVGMTAFSLMSAGLLLFCLYNPWGSVFSNRMLRSFGKYSYAIYVLHVIILPFVIALKPVVGLALFTGIFVGLSYVGGWTSWHLYEVHFLRLKRFFPSGSPIPWQPQRGEGSMRPHASKPTLV